MISAAAVIVSAIVGGSIALHSIRTQRGIARKRATLDLLVQKEWDRAYIEARAEFIALRDASSGLAFWAAQEHRNSPQVTIIRNMLNDYELIAVGIREGILDEALYKRWFKTAFLKDMEAAAGFIDLIRKSAGTAAIFAEAEWLARKWRTAT